MIEQRVTAVLLAAADVTALVGNRIFPVVVRQNTRLPAITYARQSSERDYVLTGSLHYARALIGLTAWANEYAEARALADAIRQALDAYDEPDGIDLATVNDGQDIYEPEADVFGCSLLVTVQFEED
jgi:hypothetical protein